MCDDGSDDDELARNDTQNEKRWKARGKGREMSSYLIIIVMKLAIDDLLLQKIAAAAVIRFLFCSKNTTSKSKESR